MSEINSSSSKTNAIPILLFSYTTIALLFWVFGGNLSEGDFWFTSFWIGGITIFVVYGCAEKTKKNEDLLLFSAVGYLILFSGVFMATDFIKDVKHSKVDIESKTSNKALIGFTEASCAYEITDSEEGLVPTIDGKRIGTFERYGDGGVQLTLVNGFSSYANACIEKSGFADRISSIPSHR